ncbi:MAG: gliding motility-associated C-terminal domain-containing protein, partial [Bacteroidales bacterium]
MADVIKWYTGETTKTITIKPKISLIAYCDIAMSSDKGKCSGRIFKAVEVKNCSKMFFPSGCKLDGYTKVYGPIGKIDTNRKYYFAIFSRSGKRIFETQDLKVGWDGKYKGQWVPAGVYVYYFKEIYDRFVWDRNGNITVIK